MEEYGDERSVLIEPSSSSSSPVVLVASSSSAAASSSSAKRKGPFSQEEKTLYNLEKRQRLLATSSGKLLMPGEKNPLVQSLSALNALLPPPMKYYAYADDPTTPYLRSVPGYIYTYKSNAKGRWVGRTIMAMFAAEFATYPTLYYRAALADGRVTVNGLRVGEGHVLKLGDVVCHTVHRHEPPVRVGWGLKGGTYGSKALASETGSSSCSSSSSSPSAPPSSSSFPLVSIVASTCDYIAVDKPPTMPVHPCGSYHFNSLFHALCDQDPTLRPTVALNPATSALHETGLYSVHRLDRLTSGLMLIGRTKDFATRLCALIEGRRCEKIYLARVAGHFPPQPDGKERRGRLPRIADDVAQGVKGGVLPSGAGAFGFWWSDPPPPPLGGQSAAEVCGSGVSSSYLDGSLVSSTVASLLRRETPLLPTLTVCSAIRQADYQRGGYETGDYAVSDPAARHSKQDKGAAPPPEEGDRLISALGW